MDYNGTVTPNVVKELANCTGCGACVNICVHNAIKMYWIEGFLYPRINMSSCMKCGQCHRICPANQGSGNTYYDNRHKPPRAYAVQVLDEDVRAVSSSGGVFSQLADQILKAGGAVYGVQYTPEFKTAHTCVTDSASLGRLRGSKYLQSEMGLAMREAKTMLLTGQLVLFSGTPCQIGGLKSYLGKGFDNLFCVDIVCHGVPSPLVWEKYLAYRMKNAESKYMPTRVNMRSKKSGWTRYSYSMEIAFDNGNVYLKHNRKDPYMSCFASDICLRESCYHCQYRKVEHEAADLTLADFWGVEKQHLEMDDNKGTSLVLIHTEKGAELLQQCTGFIKMVKTDINRAVAANQGALQQPLQSRHRLKLEFMHLVNESSFELAYRKMIRKLYFVKVLDKFKNFLKRDNA
ncbi:Coenzyme F420 hydrogenase/dehydrogenase, beta subunit C-terminal domain [Desulforamulus aquiferis]|uniref:Coenzyme F420 hydrogenase/dehydrogenase, beta subunit C-terminal domain n=1 Tax=Desulforamulus aquiferis TaxID=1397668 RepID=A0AAW7ZCJ0_9FIRM|nr:Coenzyme F420 hydrogenase/dehydrogenase, beta subunit C-terminal domain [Desulforamulus aquiferis]MDO7786869.1 Coenzyme F420 hydrogenase/dehydrogenase, beta subunit C-terminal domain [Desulforamulus aquiferis]